MIHSDNWPEIPTTDQEKTRRREEAARYWDTHDVTLENTKEVTEEIHVRKPLLQTYSIRLDDEDVPGGDPVRTKPGEIRFEVYETEEGSYEARALGHSIFTVGDSWDDLKDMVKDAVLCHFEDGDAPGVIMLTLWKPEVLTE